METALCSENDVTGYPTLKFFKKDDEAEAEKYRGQRDMAALVKFINKKMGLEVEEEVSVARGKPVFMRARLGLSMPNARGVK